MLASSAIVLLLFGISLIWPAALGMGGVKLAVLMLCALDSATALALLIILELYALIALILFSRRGRACHHDVAAVGTDRGDSLRNRCLGIGIPNATQRPRPPPPPRRRRHNKGMAARSAPDEWPATVIATSAHRALSRQLG